MSMRVGTGFDVHRFADNRALILGGVEIPAARGLDGVSDADVVLHTVCDAILGALGKGDIGDLYPPEDTASQGIDSTLILQKVLDFMNESGYEIGNIDITIILEEVRLKKHKETIVAGLVRLMNLRDDQVGFKIKSQEKLMAPEKSCAMCFATVLLERK
jgi:2-C-methyl-D-erythritol 2,4-cyclodiphosphate synthase